MNTRTDRCRLVLSLAGLFLAGSLSAAPLGGASLQPVAVEPSIELAIPQGDMDALVALARESVYTVAKDLGCPVETLQPALAQLTEQARQAQVDMAAVYDITASVMDYDAAMKLERFLIGYAETVGFGRTIDGQLPEDLQERLADLKGPKKKLDFGAIPRLPGDMTPNNGGTCRLCTDTPDFGPFTPTTSWQYHSESTDAANDCNWYSFNLTAGTTYEFSLCSADGASASWDTILELYNPSCTLATSNDDSCSLQSKIVYAATTTGVWKLKLKGFSTAFGSYTLGYRSSACSSCLSPISTLPTPTTTCQIVSGSVSSSCPTLFYYVQLNAGQTYIFTTCNGDCSAVSCTTISDTYLELYFPTSTACSTSTSDRAAFSDDASPSCTGFSLRSRITYTPTVSGLFKIKARAYSSSTSGTICMGYYTTSAGCANNCSTGPFLTTLTPTTTCQTHSSSVVSPCSDTWYLVNITSAGTYEFTTCTATCPGGATAFDSIIELYNSSCTLVASDNDGCGAPRSSLTTVISTPGTYKLRMRSATGASGAYTLTYRLTSIPCTSPSGVVVTPTSGITNTAVNTCNKTQAFSVTSSGSSTMTYNWTITPPAGGTAAPASGSSTGASGSTNPGTFTSTLTREGNFTVNVNAVNACGNSSTSITYQLIDNTAPVFLSFPANTTVQCTSVPPAPVLSASDNCDPNPTETFSETTTPGSCPGNYRITRTWTARDRAGNTSAPRSQIITVVDTTPPVIVPDPTVKYCIYPPNHELVCFLKSQFNPVITDNCSNPVTWRFAGILSSEQGLEPCGDGDQDPDAVVSTSGDGFCVRSERCGQDPSLNDGRIYLLLATATDACGNTSQPTPVGTILVPHDNSDTSNCIYPQ